MAFARTSNPLGQSRSKARPRGAKPGRGQRDSVGPCERRGCLRPSKGRVEPSGKAGTRNCFPPRFGTVRSREAARSLPGARPIVVQHSLRRQVTLSGSCVITSNVDRISGRCARMESTTAFISRHPSPNGTSASRNPPRRTGVPCPSDAPSSRWVRMREPFRAGLQAGSCCGLYRASLR